MNDALIQGISALVGTLGFSLMFRLKGKKLICASLGGAVVWGAYYLLNTFVFEDVFVCNLIASMIATAYSQILARILKAPATLFIFPSIVVLVPGGMLYYSMGDIISGNMTNGIVGAVETLKVAVALAFGIVIIVALTKVIYYFIDFKKVRKKDEKGI